MLRYWRSRKSQAIDSLFPEVMLPRASYRAPPEVMRFLSESTAKAAAPFWVRLPQRSYAKPRVTDPNLAEVSRARES